MRIAFAEWPDGLLPDGPTWEAVAAAAEAMAPDLLITSPLPFGPWLATTRRFDRVAAERSVALHAEGLAALAFLDIPAIVTSRPVWSGERLVNEGIVIEGSTVRFLHGKHVLPQQDGWLETDWYVPGRDEFLPADILGVRVGLLFCTELMFPERARQYGEAGVELIVVPRSTPAGSPCRTAGQMAAILSGSYVASSSRVGQSGVGPEFGGCGFAFAPDGRLLASTSPGSPLTVIEIDISVARRQKSRFPCYLREPVSFEAGPR